MLFLFLPKNFNRQTSKHKQVTKQEENTKNKKQDWAFVIINDNYYKLQTKKKNDVDTHSQLKSPPTKRRPAYQLNVSKTP